MRRFPLVLLAWLGFASLLNAQRLFERKRPDIIPLTGRCDAPALLRPGRHLHLTRFNNEEETFGTEPDTVYNALRPGGTPRTVPEAGWFLATRDPVILSTTGTWAWPQAAPGR